ncbi:uncharacterized protein N7458_000175 [Penicillium daleae]|uniref:Uncharacterized protein n=1 Tax=Penicillium daleae TaxID=63821 RepID=A0AAD6G840_9EURO|nr:uncharacterized protein N7458_000175 [Penicillium daleae]KAJ5464489.1 hypothetical protein N7458_000175 [Penicillium daleae]
MQFFVVLLLVATLLATTANAAECSSYHGSYTCLNSTALLEYREIIDSCLGHRNGGSYSLDGWSMEIDFCA